MHVRIGGVSLAHFHLACDRFASFANPCPHLQVSGPDRLGLVPGHHQHGQNQSAPSHNPSLPSWTPHQAHLPRTVDRPMIAPHLRATRFWRDIDALHRLDRLCARLQSPGQSLEDRQSAIMAMKKTPEGQARRISTGSLSRFLLLSDHNIVLTPHPAPPLLANFGGGPTSADLPESMVIWLVTYVFVRSCDRDHYQG